MKATRVVELTVFVTVELSECSMDSSWVVAAVVKMVAEKDVREVASKEANLVVDSAAYWAVTMVERMVIGKAEMMVYFLVSNKAVLTVGKLDSEMALMKESVSVADWAVRSAMTMAD